MKANITVQNIRNKSIERNETASWCNSEKQKEITNANIPFEIDVFHAKDWVDNENQR